LTIATNVDSVDHHLAGLWFIEPGDQADDACLPCSRGSNQRRDLARLDNEAHILQNWGFGNVAETDSIEVDSARELRRWNRAFPIFDLSVRFQQFAYPFVTDRSLGVRVGHLRNFLHRFVHLSQIQNENDQNAGGHSSAQNHNTRHVPPATMRSTIGLSLAFRLRARNANSIPSRLSSSSRRTS